MGAVQSNQPKLYCYGIREGECYVRSKPDECYNVSSLYDISHPPPKMPFSNMLSLLFVLITRSSCTEQSKEADISHSLALTPSAPLGPILVLQDFKGTWLLLGSVMLVMTGAEAMYADLGHFCVGAVRVSHAMAGLFPLDQSNPTMIALSL